MSDNSIGIWFAEDYDEDKIGACQLCGGELGTGYERYCAGCYRTVGSEAPAQVGRNAKRQDPQGLGPKDEHAVAEGDAPTPSSSHPGDSP
jgi:hypothetical protein